MLYVVLSVRVWSMCCGNRHRVVGIGGQRGLDPHNFPACSIQLAKLVEMDSGCTI